MASMFTSRTTRKRARMRRAWNRLRRDVTRRTKVRTQIVDGLWPKLDPSWRMPSHSSVIMGWRA